MAVQIDNIDSEIEIMPGPRAAQSSPTTASTGTAVPGTVAGRDLRGLIVKTLEQELQDYLRTRG
jgi:hypothetical protein